MMNKHPLTPQKDTLFANFMMTISFLLLSFVMFFGLLALTPPIAWLPVEQEARVATFSLFGQLIQQRASALRNSHVPVIQLWSALHLPFDFFYDLLFIGLGPSLLIRMFGSSLAAIIVASQIRASIVADLIERPAVRHISGRRLMTGRAALQSLRNSWTNRYGKSESGIELADGLVMPRPLETEHQLITGGTGAGKTTIMQKEMDGALANGDRMLCVDVKGDVTARLPTESFVLLAIDDIRGAKWAIGRDITTSVDATEMAIELVPESNDPSWSNGARQVLAALIQILQDEQKSHEVDWSWSDLNDLLSKPVEELYSLLAAAYPVEASFINVSDETRKTAMSFYLVLVACAGQIVKACAAMEDGQTTAFSVRDWVSGQDERNVLIVRQSQRSPALSASIARLVLKIIADAGAGMAFHSKPQPCWLFLDELPQIGKSEAVTRIAAIGRSAGMRIVAAIQSPAQLREIYGHEASQHFLDNMTTKIVGRVASGDTANEISAKWIGDRFVQWTEHNGFNANGTPRIEKMTKDIPVVSPDFLSSDLGIDFDALGRRVVRAIVVGHGDIARLEWSVGLWPERRPAIMAKD